MVHVFVGVYDVAAESVWDTVCPKAAPRKAAPNETRNMQSFIVAVPAHALNEQVVGLNQTECSCNADVPLNLCQTLNRRQSIPEKRQVLVHAGMSISPGRAPFSGAAITASSEMRRGVFEPSGYMDIIRNLVPTKCI